MTVCRERQAANGLLDAESGESRHGVERFGDKFHLVHFAGHRC